MSKILDNWFYWLLCIIVLRLAFTFSEKPAITPQQHSIQVLIQTAATTKDKERQILSLTALQKHAEAYPQEREAIVQLLNEKIKENKELATDFKFYITTIEKNPLYALERAKSHNAVPFFIYLEPLFYAIPILVGVFFTIFVPFFLEYFVSHRSTIVLFGKIGKKIFAIIIIAIWGYISYLFYLHTSLTLEAHIILATASILILWRLKSCGLLAILLEIKEHNIRRILYVVIIILVLSFIPYFREYFLPPQSEVSEEQLLIAVKALEQEHIPRAIPVLGDILNRPNISPQLVCAILEVLAKSDNKDVLIIINRYLQNPDENISKTALRTMAQILSNSPKLPGKNKDKE